MYLFFYFQDVTLNALKYLKNIKNVKKSRSVFMYNQQISLEKNSLFEKSQQLGLNYVLKLNPDKLLSPCYSALGKIPKEETYGGWEKQQIQGHSLGHYLSALSGFVYQTKNSEAQKKLNYTVECIKSIQREDGYFGGIPSTPFENAFSGNFKVERFSLADWWVPWYSVHKIYAGLIDAYLFGKNKTALEIVLKMADWAIEGSKNMTYEQFQKMLYCEHGGMCKVFADLYDITKEKKYLIMAERFIDREIIEPLIEKKDKLEGYHANTQIPKIIGIAKLYELTKKEEYKIASEFFFETVTQTRSYSLGGNSNTEHFGKQFSETLGRSTCETCNTYNMLELAEHIFSWNQNSKIADFYEIALYNHILASQEPIFGAKTYYVSTLPGHFKVYGTLENSFWCCVGTGMENPERYNRFIARVLDDTIYLNLFIPSTITTDDGWKLILETNFPYEQRAILKVIEEGNHPKSLKIRIPAWKESSQNGYKLESSSIKKGDIFEIALPEKIHFRKSLDNSEKFSIFYGPILLAADLGNQKMPNDIVEVHSVYLSSDEKNEIEISPIIKNLSKIQEWIKSVNSENLIFQNTKDSTSDKTVYTLKPFYDIHHTRYTVYFNSKN